MKITNISIENLPTTLPELHEMIVSLQESLQTTEQKLKTEKLKNAYLLEQFKLARQQQYSSSSEKNIYQADLFDEAGIEKEEVEVKGHTRKKHPVRKPLPSDLPREQIIHDLKEE